MLNKSFGVIYFCFSIFSTKTNKLITSNQQRQINHNATSLEEHQSCLASNLRKEKQYFQSKFSMRL